MIPNEAAFLESSLPNPRRNARSAREASSYDSDPRLRKHIKPLSPQTSPSSPNGESGPLALGPASRAGIDCESAASPVDLGGRTEEPAAMVRAPAGTRQRTPYGFPLANIAWQAPFCRPCRLVFRTPAWRGSVRPHLPSWSLRPFYRRRRLRATVQPPLHLAQVLPGVLERAAEAAAGRPPFFAALNLRGADLRCDALDLSVQKLPEVSQPRRQLAGLGALDRLQRFLHAFRLADAGGAKVLRFGGGDVVDDVAERATFPGLGGELAFWDAADEVFELLAEPLQAATVGTFVFFRDRFEVGREARRRIALADPRAFGHVRCDLGGEGPVRVDFLAVAL